MANMSWIARQEKRRATAQKYAAKRHALKAAGDYGGLARLPRDASPTRLKNRCRVTGRAHGYLRAFGVSRIVFREMAHAGLLPGVRKASW